MGKEAVTQVQEVQRVSGRINLKRNMLTFIVIKLKKKNQKQRKNIKNNKVKATHTQGNPYEVIR